MEVVVVVGEDPTVGGRDPAPTRDPHRPDDVSIMLQSALGTVRGHHCLQAVGVSDPS